MTLQQLDEALKAWKGRLSAIAENLMELQSDTGYQSLTGTGGLREVEVCGATAARCGPALRAVHGLFREFGLLQATVDQVETLRGGMPSFFGTEAKLREAEQLLLARSIEVEADEVPLAERQLASEARQRVRLTPEELLGRMTATFADVRDALAEVGRGWAECARSLEAIEAETERLRAQRALPSRLLAPALGELDENLGAVREQMRADPLGALKRLQAQAEPAVAAIALKIAKAEQLRYQLRAARAVWQGMDTLHEEARRGVAGTEGRFANLALAQGTVDESRFRALGEWLGRLEQHAEEGAAEAVAIGLRNWQAAAGICRAQDDLALSRCHQQTGAYTEMRGRLDALKAKARMRGVAAIEDTARLCAEAEALLREQPLDLARAAAAVASFERRLRPADSEVKRGVPTA